MVQSAGPMRCPQASFEAQPRIARLLAPKMGISTPTHAVRTASEILSCFKFRGKSPEKPKRFFWSVQGGSGGGNRYPPRARFLFAAFSFGDAKEKVGRQPQISNMRFVLQYVWLVVCVKGMRNLLSSLYYRDSLFINYHSSLRLSSPLDRFGRM